MESIGIVNITIVKITNIQDSDLFSGHSDPFVTVRLADQTMTTFVADVSDNEAIWDERLVFKVPTETQSLSKAQISLYDKDVWTESDKIADFEIDLSNVDLDKQFCDLYALKCADSTLHVVVHYMPMTLMGKMLERLGNSVDDLKSKLINQLVTFAKERIGL